jgi:hypothetical protein
VDEMKHDEFIQLEKLNKQYAQLEEKEESEVDKVKLIKLIFISSRKVKDYCREPYLNGSK